MFASVLPSKKPGGRVFIGFPTMQTTGAGLHISAPSLIPTVEREAIDLNAQCVKTWNIELLRCAGIIVRLAYANEVAELGDKMRRSAKAGKVTLEEVSKFMPEALHILKTFSFVDSTPSRSVRQIIEEPFWISYKNADMEVVSSQGVISASKVRIHDKEVCKFLDGIPVIPTELKESPLIQRLHEFGLISHIRVDDIRGELTRNALSKEQAIDFISWVTKKSLCQELSHTSCVSLLEAAVATVWDGNSGQVITLGSVKNFLQRNKIPPSVPIPPTTIPSEFTAKCKTAELQALGWEPLEILPWLRFLISFPPPDERDGNRNVFKNHVFAASVLAVLSKSWEGISAANREEIVNLAQNAAIMPTKMGMKKPGESYFRRVKLFDDLPTLDPSCSVLKEKFLTALGVRKTVELETIFARLLNSGGAGGKGWSHVELIKYLASVGSDIHDADMKKLSESKICPAEAGPNDAQSSEATTQLYKVDELFEPKDSLRLLGLRCLRWPGPPGSYMPNSAEGRFLTALGLRPFPDVPELVDMMCSTDQGKRVAAGCWAKYPQFLSPQQQHIPLSS